MYPRVSFLGNFSKFNYIFCLTGVFLILSSCSPSLKFSYVTYDSKSVNALLDSPNVNSLTLQYITDNANTAKEPFKLLSYAADSTGYYLNIPPYHLNKAEGRKPKKFKGEVIMGNLTLPRNGIDSLLTSSVTNQRIRKFDYLLFIPMLDSEYNYLYYDIKAVGAELLDAKPYSTLLSTRPCPPAQNCPPKPSSPNPQ